MTQTTCPGSRYQAYLIGYDADGNVTLLDEVDGQGKWLGAYCAWTSLSFQFGNNIMAPFPSSRVRLVSRYTVDGVDGPVEAHTGLAPR